jgi:hypothetical protein
MYKLHSRGNGVLADYMNLNTKATNRLLLFNLNFNFNFKTLFGVISRYRGNRTLLLQTSPTEGL